VSLVNRRLPAVPASPAAALEAWAFLSLQHAQL
jgi:hypothetical protein